MSKKKRGFWQVIWDGINGRKTSIATILNLLNGFAMTKGYYDSDTMILISSILVALGLTANAVNAQQRANQEQE